MDVVSDSSPRAPIKHVNENKKPTAREVFGDILGGYGPSLAEAKKREKEIADTREFLITRFLLETQHRLEEGKYWRDFEEIYNWIDQVINIRNSFPTDGEKLAASEFCNLLDSVDMGKDGVEILDPRIQAIVNKILEDRKM